MAVVNLDTPYFKGHPTVGLVAYLAADALLGMDILGKSETYVVTRSNLSPYEGFTKYVAIFGFLSLILRFGARQFFVIWPMRSQL
jgi:hypothetical protein